MFLNNSFEGLTGKCPELGPHMKVIEMSGLLFHALQTAGDNSIILETFNNLLLLSMLELGAITKREKVPLQMSVMGLMTPPTPSHSFT